MEKKSCPSHTLRPWWNRWLHRAVALLFIYTALTVPAGATLRHTPLVKTVLIEYPTVLSVLIDIALTFFVVGVGAIALNTMLRITKKHHLPKNWQRRLERIDDRLFRNLVTLMYFFARWIIIALSALLLWFGPVRLLVAPWEPAFHFPSLFTQPIISGMGILGIGLLLDSASYWRKKFTRYFCIHYTR